MLHHHLCPWQLYKLRGKRCLFLSWRHPHILLGAMLTRAVHKPCPVCRPSESNFVKDSLASISSVTLQKQRMHVGMCPCPIHTVGKCWLGQHGLVSTRCRESKSSDWNADHSLAWHTGWGHLFRSICICQIAEAGVYNVRFKNTDGQTEKCPQQEKSDIIYVIPPVDGAWKIKKK